MSIPKEPRQLMINLMYLVLTALLALNVSAEVMNAFFTLDKSIGTSTTLVSKSNETVVKSMNLAIEKRPQYKPVVDASSAISSTINEFNTYIDGVRSQLDEAAGGLLTEADTNDPTKVGKPKRFQDKEITTRLFIDGLNGKSPLGPELKEKIVTLRADIIKHVENAGKIQVDGAPIMRPTEIDSLKDKMTIEIDEKSWADHKKKSWEHFTFDHMPVASLYPVLRKFQSDAKSTEATILNELAKKIGSTTIEFDQFEPVASAEKAYVIKGEKFTAEIFLSASSTQAASGISYRVNGSALPIKDGKGIYTANPSSNGEQSYKVDISLKNPFTGKVDNFSKTFKYEVGERSVAVSADKMNVFYIGVDNPVSVSAAGVPSTDVQVNVSGSGGGSINKVATGKYTVRVTTPTPAGSFCNVDVAAPKAGLRDSKQFRVKRIPDPVPLLGAQHNSRAMGNGEFKAQSGIAAVLQNFDFDVKCDMVGFNMTYVAKRQDPVEKINSGARYSSETSDLVSKAKPGDIYYFDNIRAKCPGDGQARNLGGLVFKIQ